VVGVAVARGRVVSRALGVGLAVATLARTHPGISVARVARALIVDATELGEGYGYPTPAGQTAIEIAGQVGLELDATYTAKAFLGRAPLARLPRVACQAGHGFRGCSLARVFRTTVARLYWHTLSAAPALLAAEAGWHRFPPVCARYYLAASGTL